MFGRRRRRRPDQRVIRELEIDTGVVEAPPDRFADELASVYKSLQDMKDDWERHALYNDLTAGVPDHLRRR